MKKSTLILWSLLLLLCPALNAQQWDGTTDVTINLGDLPNNTYDEVINVASPITANNVPLNTTCAQNDTVRIIAKSETDTLAITICNTVTKIPFIFNSVQIKNDNQKKLIFTQPQSTEQDTGNVNFPFKIDSTVFNIYYDALVMLEGSNAQKQIIIHKYQLDLDSLSNTFLSSFSANLAGLQSANAGQEAKNFAESDAMGIDITQFADGFAKFIASRFKKELTIAFFNRFKATLNNPKLHDLTALFKNTAGELELIDDQFTQYQAYLTSLRESMEYDCQLLPERLQELVESPTSQLNEALNKYPNFQFVLDNVLLFGIDLRDSVNAGKALASLDFSKSFGPNPVDKNLRGGFETIQLISESLRNIETDSTDSYWITNKEIDGLITNDKLFKIFLGLLAQKAKLDRINLSDGSLYSILNSKTTIELEGLIESIITSIQDIEGIYNANPSAIPDDNKYITALRYFDAASDLINTSDHLEPLLSTSQAKKLNVYNGFADDINSMTRSFVTKKYSIGLLYVSRILSKVDSTSSALKEINTIIGNQGLFIAQMAEAENSDDVAAILENFAAPIGSWRDKRIAQWNIAIDSYIGPALYSVKDDGTRAAFSTPIGASVTFPWNNFTLFLSAFDIGPVTSFRLTNDTSQVANIYLKEIVAPGAFISVNFGQSFPLTLNVGYQRFPLLEKVGETQNNINVTRRDGFAGSIVMNIPLFTIYNDPKD
ncbi:MAG: hypothetical protein AAGA77_12765 [Bacteroidota bacterium]